MDRASPLFSILIPTMNRPELVRDAINSVVLQDCPRLLYELVVSNNGGCSKTARLIAGFQEKYSIRYIQPEHELNMPDHWEWASLQLSGQYVLVLPDRRMLRQGTLLLLARLIEESRANPIEVITWPDAWLYRSGVLVPNGNGKDFVTHSTDAVIHNLKEQYLDITVLPLGLNSFVKREILDKVRAIRGRAYSALSPDFSSAFSILCVAKRIVRSSAYLTITQGFWVSNGGKALSSDTSYLKSLNEDDRALRHVPIKDFLVWASIYEDFFRAMHDFGRKVVWNDLNPAFFYVRCWQEIMSRRLNKPFSRGASNLVFSFYAALSQESPERRLMVKAEMKRVVSWPIYVRQLLKRAIAPTFLSKVRAVHHKLMRGKCYSSALEASGFEPTAAISLDLGQL